jgi:exopolysaccharide biosynthesis polyprenyl glycosylphosphotransferase
MKNNSSLIYSILLIVGDFLALIAAFSIAYVIRVEYDERSLITQVPAETYLYAFLAILPIWILMHAVIGLYSRKTYENRFSEFGKLIVGSFLGILIVIGYDFVADFAIFPARLVVVYGFLLGFVFLVVFRTLARATRGAMFSFGYGIENVLLVGEGPLAKSIIEQLSDSGNSGYRVLAVVGKDRFEGIKSYKSFESATKNLNPGDISSIVQTQLNGNGLKNEEIFLYAQAHHIAYRFIPGNSEVLVGNIEVELFRETPVVTVHQTALLGWGRAVKRVFDLLLALLTLTILSPLILLVVVVQKILAPKADVFLRQKRLTQYDKSFCAYKFRSIKQEYNGLSPEEAFAKMGKPKLIKTYRVGGDHLPHDPRFSALGKILRATSIDELPQLFNVIKGDISLVGPRALVPEELKNYKHRHHILSVKSGMTGLAQVSGRRDISFEERRKMDMYYVQNWSFWLDISILLRTIRAVISGIGAK